MKTLTAIALAAALLTTAAANASAPTTDTTVAWARGLATDNEPQVAGYCTTTCNPTYSGGYSCQQYCY